MILSKRNLKIPHLKVRTFISTFLEGKWSEEEDVSLVQGIEKFGRRWLKISAEAVKTRSPAACIKRAQAMTKTLQ